MMAGSCPVCPINAAMCPICVGSTIGLSASMETGSKMGQAKDLSDGQTTAVNPTMPTGTPSPTSNSFTSSPAVSSAAAQAAQAAQAAGMSIAPDYSSFTTPDGRTINLNTAGANGLPAGLTPAEANALKSALKDAQAAGAKAAGAVKTQVAVNEMSGDGSHRGEIAPVKVAKTVHKRVPISVAGAFKDINGDRIGVAADSMFEMISRRYAASVEQNYLMQSEAKAAAKKLPEL
jgi:hypothetical protein